MARQPVRRQEALVADSAGMASATFAPVPTGLAFFGSLHVEHAPTTAHFCATVGPDDFGCFWGTQAQGPITVQDGEELELSATGLMPGETYVAWFIGEADNADLVPFAVPSSSGIPPATTANQVARHEANTVSSGTLIGAPGAGFSIVIYTVQITMGWVATPSGTTVGRINSTALGPLIETRGANVEPVQLNFGGFQLPSNDPLSWEIVATPDGAGLHFFVTYTILPAS